jgi:DNA-3-methyladenine glycosylase II
MQLFQYGPAEIEYLKRRDRKLGKAIDTLGIIERQVIPDLFTALVRSMVAQQISRRAADTVWSRLRATCLEITPESIASADVSGIQKCGLSMRKAHHIKGIGEAVIGGRLNLLEFAEMPDDLFVRRLSGWPGIGVWTAEMLLIFSLGRPDVVSWKDLGIRRGMMNLYGIKKITQDQFNRYRKRYSPYGSVASLYLWTLSAKSRS